MNTTTANIELNDSDQEDLLILNIKFIVYVGFLLPLSIIGLILNSFTIVVLLHPRMRNSTNAYLTALSIANIFCLIFFIIMYSLRFMLSFEMFKDIIYFKQVNLNGYENFINLIYPFGSPIFSTFQLYAIYLTCAVTCDRWIYLKWPLKADLICTIRTTLKIILSIFVFCVVYNLPRWFEVETTLVNNNSSFYQAKLTSLSKNVYYHMIYQRYCYIIFVYGIPFLILLVVNIGIIQKLIETKKRKNNLLGKKTNETKCNLVVVSNKPRASIKNGISIGSIDPKTTLMVLAVVLAFFCCQFPYLLLHLLRDPMAKEESFYFKFAKTICDLLVALNCCINFLIYCFFGQNFRHIAKQMLMNPTLKPYSYRSSSFHSRIQRSGSERKHANSNKRTESIKLTKIDHQEP
jgi:hypothetical protein